MRKTTKNRGLLFLSGLAVFFICFKLLEDDLLSFMEVNKDKSYIQVNKETEFQGKIVSLVKNRGVIYFELQNGTKLFSLDNINTNYPNEQLTLFRIVAIGDSLWKGKSSDSIQILKHGQILAYPIP